MSDFVTPSKNQGPAVVITLFYTPLFVAEAENADLKNDGPSWSLGILQNYVTPPVKVDFKKGGGVGENMLEGPSWSLGVSQIECVPDTTIKRGLNIIKNI
ncbi:hypothetical protein R6Q59_001631 [Mikania micrantha]